MPNRSAATHRRAAPEAVNIAFRETDSSHLPPKPFQYFPDHDFSTPDIQGTLRALKLADGLPESSFSNPPGEMRRKMLGVSPWKPMTTVLKSVQGGTRGWVWI